MTLILVLGNPDQVIQISDRRASVNGTPRDDESNKAGVLISADGILAYAFTGLARYSGFDTSWWLNSALYDCGPPDYKAYHILQRLNQRASRDFQAMPPLRGLTPKHKAVAFVFSGYLTDRAPPRSVFAVLSNSTALADVETDGDTFEFQGIVETGPGTSDFSLVRPVGFCEGVDNNDLEALQTLMEAHKPATAIIGKGIEVMRAIADRPRSKGMIGKQLSSIIVARHQMTEVKTQYHSDLVTYESYIPDTVFLQGDGRRCANIGARLEPLNRSAALPLHVPKVGRNAPCPCGSGKKYKHCHGRTRAP